MSFIKFMKETLDSGDPIIRSWFLVQSYWTPFVCSSLYLVFVKFLGPALMRNRQPFDLRLLMILYNFSIVLVYTGCLLTLVYYFFTTDAYQRVCTTVIVIEGDYTYNCSVAGWLICVIKYAEYADTVFFVLRKKFHLITNLHVIHHAVLPIICWIMMRTERSGFQLFLGCVNSLVHVIMYTYYALAAMGPEIQKRLWWKKHLTLLQMAQFIVILLFVFIILPISGCKTTKHAIFIDVFFALLFLTMFYNYFTKTYKKSLKTTANGVNVANGVCMQNGHHLKQS